MSQKPTLSLKHNDLIHGTKFFFEILAQSREMLYYIEIFSRVNFELTFSLSMNRDRISARKLSKYHASFFAPGSFVPLIDIICFYFLTNLNKRLLITFLITLKLHQSFLRFPIKILRTKNFGISLISIKQMLGEIKTNLIWQILSHDGDVVTFYINLFNF
jgi:hypothetical protein